MKMIVPKPALTTEKLNSEDSRYEAIFELDLNCYETHSTHSDPASILWGYKDLDDEEKKTHHDEEDPGGLPTVVDGSTPDSMIFSLGLPSSRTSQTQSLPQRSTPSEDSCPTLHPGLLLSIHVYDSLQSSLYRIKLYITHRDHQAFKGHHAMQYDGTAFVWCQLVPDGATNFLFWATHTEALSINTAGYDTQNSLSYCWSVTRVLCYSSLALALPLFSVCSQRLVVWSLTEPKKIPGIPVLLRKNFSSVIAASVVCGLPLQNVYPSTSSNVLGGGHPDSSLYPRGQLCCGFSRGNTPHNGGGETAHDRGGNTAHDRGDSPPHGSGGNTPRNCGSNTFHGSGGDTESRGSGDTDCGSRLDTANGANDRSAPVGSFTYISSDGSHSDSVPNPRNPPSSTHLPSQPPTHNPPEQQDDAASSKESTYSSVTGAEYGSARSRQSAPSISSARQPLR
ncbi:hypothetical protein EV360DRAFT_70630 [Lentinula raphanica]|nr:hypothetical protein EV360DRAFT_70630 [Lentinula raphanica]